MAILSTSLSMICFGFAIYIHRLYGLKFASMSLV
jgi:hypothetical protein